MGIEMLSGSKRSTFLNRAERRGKQDVIATAVVEMLEDDLTSTTEADNAKAEQVEAERRHYILHGHHPADGHQLRTYELDELTASLGELSPAERESISSQSVVAKGGIRPSPLWSASHHALLRAAASDRRVARIFVDPVAKVAMCQAERGNRAYLRKIRPINNHDYHFHVRLACTNAGCQDQDPPPPGDGCAEAQQWIANRINPPPAPPPDPEYRHPRSFRLSEMPPGCRALVAR